jgi:hypothetical protein
MEFITAFLKLLSWALCRSEVSKIHNTRIFTSFSADHVSTIQASKNSSHNVRARTGWLEFGPQTIVTFFPFKIHSNICLPLLLYLAGGLFPLVVSTKSSHIFLICHRSCSHYPSLLNYSYVNWASKVLLITWFLSVLISFISLGTNRLPLLFVFDT